MYPYHLEFCLLNLRLKWSILIFDYKVQNLNCNVTELDMPRILFKDPSLVNTDPGVAWLLCCEPLEREGGCLGEQGHVVHGCCQLMT